ncbi:allergin-1 [Tiliqua scincoides]|uniref:allergin-1 n=1 Tax=Tiliqua scincoides TaxID=71010 RepID=UPI0034628DA2
MLKSVYIVCLLLANFLPSQLSQGDSKEDEGVQDDSTEKKKGGLPKNVLSCSRNVSKPMIYSPSQEATIGWNVTLECVSQNGSPPINYTLYKGQNRMLPTVIKDKADDKALFNFTINSYDELGEYKCKVQNRCLNSSRYSTGFSFKAPKKDNAVVFIVSPLLLLIVLAVIISLLILWCRASPGLTL